MINFTYIIINSINHNQIHLILNLNIIHLIQDFKLKFKIKLFAQPMHNS
jgi:hypothetical protein